MRGGRGARCTSTARRTGSTRRGAASSWWRRAGGPAAAGRARAAVACERGPGRRSARPGRDRVDRAGRPRSRGAALAEHGMVDFGAVAAAYARDVEANGGEIRRGAGVRAIVEREDHVEAVLGDGAIVAARRAVACAGAWSDRLALASGARPDVRIVPVPRRLPAARAGARAISCAGRSTRCPTRRCRSSACTSRARSGATCSSARPRCSPRARGPGARRCAGRAPGASSASWWRTGIRELAHAMSRRLVMREAARFVPELGPATCARARRLPRPGGRP